MGVHGVYMGVHGIYGLFGYPWVSGTMWVPAFLLSQYGCPQLISTLDVMGVHDFHDFFHGFYRLTGVARGLAKSVKDFFLRISAEKKGRVLFVCDFLFGDLLDQFADKKPGNGQDVRRF
jgi:hypothetical protein